MTEEEKKALEEVNAKIKEASEAAAAKAAEDAKKSSEEKIAEVQKNLDEVNELAKNQEKQIADLKGAVENARKEKAVEFASKMSRKAVYAAVIKSMLVEGKEDIAKMQGNRNAGWGKSVKDPEQMKAFLDSSIADNTNGNPLLGSSRNTIVDPLSEGIHMRDIVATETTNTRYIFWPESKAGSAAAVSEGATKTDADIEWVVNEAETQVIANYIKVSKQALSDVEGCAEKLANQLAAAVLKEEDKEILAGTGTAPHLNGILTLATAFNTTSTNPLYHLVVDAQQIDVLRAAIMQVRLADGNANTIVINPADGAKIDLLKATDDQYISKDVSEILKNCRIIETNSMAAGSFLVCDMSKSHYAIQWDMHVEMGYDKDDFTKNLVTLRCEVRGAHYIAGNERPAFVKGAFSTAIAAIAVP